MKRASAPLQTVIRAFEVIELLWEQNITGPSDLAKHMDIPRSTAHDYLRTLEATGYVVHRNGRYQIGYRFLATGSRLKHRSRLFHIAKPVLERLAAETGELATVSIEEEGRWIVLHNESGAQSLNLGTYPGRKTPLHSHAAGKVILAFLSDTYVDEILRTHGLDPVTENTIIDRGTLLAELETIKDNGYAVDWNQQIPGMGVVAAPLLVDSEILGSVSVACPTDRIKDSEYCSELIHQVHQGAKIITDAY